MKIAHLCWQTFSCAAWNKTKNAVAINDGDGVLLLMVERSLTLTLKAHLSCLLAHASNKWLLSGSNIILGRGVCQLWLFMIRSSPQDTTGPAEEGLGQRRDQAACVGRASDLQRQQNVLPGGWVGWLRTFLGVQGSAPPQIYMLSRYLQREWNHLSFVMATRGLQAQNFHHFTLWAVQNCSLCQLRGEMTCHTGIRTWSHRRHHVMSNVLPGCTHHCCHFPH